MKAQRIKNKLILSLFILNALCFEVIGKNIDFIQTGDYSYLFTPQNLGTSTPQVTDMIRYGNIPVNKYHGLLDFGVALDGYKDRNFDIPISLKYISSGFMPSKRPSVVGYNWVLNSGGMITRTLNGSPDDTKGRYRDKENRDYLLDGILVAIRDGRYKNYTDENLMSFNVEFNGKGKGTPYEGKDFKYELEPDIFTFTFGHYYGRFIIGKNGVPVLLEENGCKVDINGMAIQSYSTTEAPISSVITITTPDGYIYTFGGTNNYLEYFIPNNPAKCKIMPRYITSWFLKSIKAPNQRTVNFSYHSKTQLNKYRYIAFAKSSTYSHYENIATVDQDKQNIEIKDKIYTPILDSISVNNVSIRFNYDENLASLYSGESDDKSVQLKKISYYVNNAFLKEVAFTYENKDQYFFLKSILQKGLKHEFKYNLSKTLPDPMTISLDHWGFWSGGYETNISNLEDYCLDMQNKRAVNPEVCDVGLLNEVIYPTGGVTKITYEHNRYDTYFDTSTSYLGFIPRKKTKIEIGRAHV